MPENGWKIFLRLYRQVRKRHTIYAKNLVDLREKKKQLKKDLGDDLDAHSASKTTLNELYDRYIKQKYDLKPTT